MKGDFSRDTFRPERHFARVLMQQGRVQLDADWNEQVAIQEHRHELQVKDIIGQAGAPAAEEGGGFEITAVTAEGDLLISPGHIYVDGILCECEQPGYSYLKQPYYLTTPAALNPVADRRDLVYLDVWQRHITAIEEPDLCEPALGGPDTTTRVQTVWQVRVEPEAVDDKGKKWDEITQSSAGQLTVSVAAGAGYQVQENCLYRVEIHKASDDGKVAFKWSRDNGAVAFAVAAIPDDKTVELRPLGRQTMPLRPGEWIELSDDDTELQGQAGALLEIVSIDEAKWRVTVDEEHQLEQGKHPKVRRWEGGAAQEVKLDQPIPLENGIEIRFAAGKLKVGDYWVFAARADGGIEPLKAALPHGIQRHYCQLATVTWQGNAGNWAGSTPKSLRPVFRTLTYSATGGLSTVTLGEPGIDDLNQALEKLMNVSPGVGGSICIPAGRWPKQETATQKTVAITDKQQRVTIFGCGPASVIQFDGQGALFSLQGASQICFRDFAVECTGKDAIAFHVVEGTDNSDLVIENCDIRMEKGYGVVLGQVTGGGATTGLDRLLLRGNHIEAHCAVSANVAPPNNVPRLNRYIQIDDNVFTETPPAVIEPLLGMAFVSVTGTGDYKKSPLMVVFNNNQVYCFAGVGVNLDAHYLLVMGNYVDNGAGPDMCIVLPPKPSLGAAVIGNVTTTKITQIDADVLSELRASELANVVISAL